MTRPRRTLVSLDDTPYYHCVTRCARRAFLCGEDPYTGIDYSHRREWIAKRLAHLAEVFAIDVCAYAVMSNHAHFVLRINRDAAYALSEAQVIDRWKALFSLPVLIDRYRDGHASSEAEKHQAQEIIHTWRQRLMDLSWFMRCLNEHIARRANAEDGCTGRYWEGRFKSQALLDEAALLTCMAYVDLNPVRAKLADTPEDSAFTSVRQRIHCFQGKRAEKHDAPSIRLLPFQEADSRTAADHLPFTLMDYLDLVDWSGRAVRQDKPGLIPSAFPPILHRLGIDRAEYLETLRCPRNRFGIAIGAVAALSQLAERLRQAYIRGVGTARLLFPLRPT